jgi:hypothetical protein
VCNIAVDTTPPRATVPPVVNVGIMQPFTIPQLSNIGDFSDTTVTVTLGDQRVAQVCGAACGTYLEPGMTPARLTIILSKSKPSIVRLE